MARKRKIIRQLVERLLDLTGASGSRGEKLIEY
jgi:hypothetical protein